MKKGLMKRISALYAGHLGAAWQRVGVDYMRREGDWLQIVAFNPSRFSDIYIPRCCFEFLKLPGPVLGSMLVQELHGRHGTQKWVRASLDSADIGPVFSTMAEQFKPSILEAFTPAQVRALLESALDYWPHVYALCVMAAENQERKLAQSYFDMYCNLVADKPYDWADERRQELTRVIQLMDESDSLRQHLANISTTKLREIPALTSRFDK